MAQGTKPQGNAYSTLLMPMPENGKTGVQSAHIFLSGMVKHNQLPTPDGDGNPNIQRFKSGWLGSDWTKEPLSRQSIDIADGNRPTWGKQGRKNTLYLTIKGGKDPLIKQTMTIYGYQTKDDRIYVPMFYPGIIPSMGKSGDQIINKDGWWEPYKSAFAIIHRWQCILCHQSRNTPDITCRQCKIWQQEMDRDIIVCLQPYRNQVGGRSVLSKPPSTGDHQLTTVQDPKIQQNKDDCLCEWMHHSQTKYPEEKKVSWEMLRRAVRNGRGSPNCIPPTQIPLKEMFHLKIEGKRGGYYKSCWDSMNQDQQKCAELIIQCFTKEENGSYPWPQLQKIRENLKYSWSYETLMCIIKHTDPSRDIQEMWKDHPAIVPTYCYYFRMKHPEQATYTSENSDDVKEKLHQLRRTAGIQMSYQDGRDPLTGTVININYTMDYKMQDKQLKPDFIPPSQIFGNIHPEKGVVYPQPSNQN